ncbi:MAG TPA: SRPBCC family protein [Candidatus Sulfomarinibacteraceae bacterium]|nr:SRPBCC family protein [Candidatus Sulfomarinibacteraceae bacterium]
MVVQVNETRQNVGDSERLLSLAGGGALLVAGLRQGRGVGLLLAPVGVALLYRGLTGRSRLYEQLEMDTSEEGSRGIEVRKSVTVNKEPMEVYEFWRELENLPRFMNHLEAVEKVGEGRSCWRVKMAPGPAIEWEAELTEDRPGEVIGWQTLPGSDVAHRGEVHFARAPGNRGTEVTVHMQYRPPAGAAGELFARLANAVTAQEIKEEIRNFKRLLEAGELPTVEGQPAGGGR